MILLYHMLHVTTLNCPGCFYTHPLVYFSKHKCNMSSSAKNNALIDRFFYTVEYQDWLGGGRKNYCSTMGRGDRKIYSSTMGGHHDAAKYKKFWWPSVPFKITPFPIILKIYDVKMLKKFRPDCLIYIYYDILYSIFRSF